MRHDEYDLSLVNHAAMLLAQCWADLVCYCVGHSWATFPDGSMACRRCHISD